MHRSLTREVVNPATLSPAAKRALLDELHATHAAIFDGVSKAAFRRYVVDSPAERTRIELLRDGDRLVGYLAIHVFLRSIAGQRWVVIRAESGKLPRYRRRAQGRLMIAEVLRVCLRYPRWRKALLGCLIHPSSYVALGHVAPQMYPHWTEPTPTRVESVMHELAQDFGLDIVDASRPGVREVGWITKETDAERRSWAARDCAMTRLYVERNPNYRAGHGLLTFVPVSLRALVDGSTRHALRLARRAWSARPRAGATEAWPRESLERASGGR